MCGAWLRGELASVTRVLGEDCRLGARGGQRHRLPGRANLFSRPYKPARRNPPMMKGKLKNCNVTCA